MADPYQTLGVARGASEADIKKAYRKLAKELHPDRNKDNPRASERFSQATSAYDLLSDKDKRARFDRGEIDGDGNPTAPFGFGGGGARPGGFGAAPGGFRADFGGDSADMGDIFDGLFGGRGSGGFASAFGGAGGGRRAAPKGANVAYRLQVPFVDAATLAPQRVTLADGASIELKLPPGVEDGTQMRLAGKGEQGLGGAGDATVAIEVARHRFFTRDGDDVRLDLPISLGEAVLGGQVRVPTVEKPVMLTIPKGASSGRTLRLKGKGFHKKSGGGARGDQLVTLMVQVPEDDVALASFVEAWPGRAAGEPEGGVGRLTVVIDAAALTPEDRAKTHASARTVLSREYARVKPGSAFFEVLKRAAGGVYDNGFIYAGNLAYLALMTLFPFFIVAAAVLSVLGQSAETQHAVASFLRYLPHDVSTLLEKPIAQVLKARTGAPLLLGGLVGLWTVSSFVDTIKDIFRRAYGTRSSASLWRSKLSTSGAIIAAVIVVLLSFLAQGLLTAAEQFVYHLLPFARGAAGWIGLSRLIPGAIMFGALYALFYFCTPSKYRHSESRKWPGALFTAIWWIGCTALLPVVLARLGGYDLTYGSLAGVVVMLLFFYLIGLGFCFGAHLNAALAEPPATGLQEPPTAMA